MLKHPWLNMPDNYDFKLSKRKIESMLLKKDMVKGQGDDKEEREMNELIDSDPEIYGADTEEPYERKKKSKQSRRD